MFKRANKITALLVAAASVMSVVPAMAADYTKVDAKEGTIYNAEAYKDGTFYIDGEVNDKDGNAYYVKDGDYANIDNVDSGDSVSIFGDKYLEVDSGDYYVDLETGKSTDDEIASDAKDDAETSLRKKLNKDTPDDRYDATAPNTYDDLDNYNATIIAGNKFSENWYEESVNAAVGNIVNGVAPTFNVYTDTEGNYIDADHNLGKVNVVYTTGSAATVKNTKDDDNNVKVKVTQVGNTIASDKDYIYRIVDVVAYLDANDDGLADGATVYNKFGSADEPIQVKDGGVVQTTIKAIQKISKAQDSENVDDAKFADTTDTYFFTSDDGTVKYDAAYNQYAVVDGKLVNYKVSGGKVYARTLTLKSDHGYYYTDISDGDNTDVETNGVDVDADGNLWALDGGYIKKYNNDDSFDKVYKVDGGFNKLSVYDKDNIVAWNEDDELYSIIGEKKVEDTTTTPVTPVVTAGWAQATDGTWTYNKADGTKATGWFQDPTGTWYYAKADGIMVANGWALYGTTWYYLGASGAMATNAWIQYGSDWYYVGGTGAMLTNTTVGGYVLGASGAWVR